MLRSLFSGVSGMKNNQIKMDVIGNNIANVSTTAFKAGRVRFQDILSQTIKNAQSPTIDGRGGINPNQVGLGMQVAGIDTMTNQGAPQPTGRPLDCAIDGEGYFVLNNGSKTVYSRDGAFGFDSDNNLINSDGFRVMGYLPNTATMKILYNDDLSSTGGLNWSNVSSGTVLKRASNLSITGPLGNVTFPQFPANTTLASIKSGTALSDGVNLGTADTIKLGDSSATLVDVPLTNVKALGTISDINSKIDIIASALQTDIDNAGLGNDYKVSRSGNSLTITASGSVDATSVVVGTSTGAGLLGYTDTTEAIGVIGMINKESSKTGVTAAMKDGSMVLQATLNIDDRANGANKIVVTGDKDFEGLSSPQDDVSVDDAIIDDTSFTDVSTLKSLSIPLNHPLKPGVKLNNYSIEANGTIKGVYDDGSVMALGKIATAKFINPGGLVKLGSNNYGTSANSGEAQVGEPGSNGSGEILQSTLEMSNVDMASEFTDMIITSRAFQANSRTITTSDEMLQELLNLKR